MRGNRAAAGGPATHVLESAPAEDHVSAARKPPGALRLNLLGGFETRLATGALVTLPTRKAQALLAYLAARPGRAHARDKLAALLWADRGQLQARDSLRHTLVALRKVLPERSASLTAADRSVAIRPAAVDVDVVRFEASVMAGTDEALARAADLYRGDLLDGFVLREPVFEEWLIAERERLRELALDALRKLLQRQQTSRAIEPAIRTAQRLLALDGTQEVAHRTLMRLYGQQGRRATALRQYQMCVDVLQRELGAEPEAETRRLYRDIVRHRDAPARATAPKPDVPARPRQRIPPHPAAREIPLIGRTSELAALRAALTEAHEGRGRGLSILGEAGVGKSRLVAEIAVEARERGSRVLFGRAYESAQILPFGPWVDAFRTDGLVADARILERLDSVWRAELTRVFPELTAPGLPAPSSDQLHLFESLGHLIGRVTERQPLVLILEDLQWADEMSLRLLSFVARRMHTWPMVIVTTVREEELADALALRRTLGELRGERHFEQLALPPLSRPDASKLVRFLAVAGSAENAVARLEEQAWATSEGNPFVIVETLRALGDGIAIAAPGRLTLPQRVRDVIATRVELLSDRTRDLLSVAAVIGREFAFMLLQRASGLTERDAAAGIEELVRRRMLHGVDDGFDFTHDRIREVVYAALLPPRRKVLHGDVAVALEALTAGSLDPPAAALGLHYRHAEVWDKAVFHLRQAGLKAVARSALPDARVWLEQALAGLDALPESPTTLEQAFEIRIELRPVLVIQGEPRRAADILREAEAIAERMNDERRRSWVWAFLANIHSQLGDQDTGLLHGTRALESARRLGDEKLRIVTTTYLEQVHYYRGEYEQAVALATADLAAIPAEWVNEYFGMGALPAIWDRHWMVLSLAELGRFAQAEPHGIEAIQIAEPTNRAFSIGIAYRTAGTIYLAKGDWTRARPFIARASEVFRRASITLHLAWAVARHAWVLGQVGESSEASTWLEEGAQLEERLAARGVAHFPPSDYHALGRASLVLDRLDDAQRFGRRALESSATHPGFAAHAHHLLGDVASDPERFDPATGEAHYRQALALAEPRGMRPLIAHCHLGLGKLSARLGKHDQSRKHLTDARSMYTEMGMPFWLQQAEAS